MGQRVPIFRIAFTMTLTMTTRILRRRINSVDDSEDVDGDDESLTMKRTRKDCFSLRGVWDSSELSWTRQSSRLPSSRLAIWVTTAAEDDDEDVGKVKSSKKYNICKNVIRIKLFQNVQMFQTGLMGYHCCWRWGWGWGSSDRVRLCFVQFL